MNLLAIDPGPSESAWVLYNLDTGQPESWAKEPNLEVLTRVVEHPHLAEILAVEMLASYGMPVGAEVFETALWIGRFVDRWTRFGVRSTPLLVYRKQVCVHLCGSARAKDGNVRQALIDRYGGKEKAVGRKATPGVLHGMAGDVWQALGVAVTTADTHHAPEMAA